MKMEAKRFVRKIRDFLLAREVRRRKPRRSETKMEKRRMLMMKDFSRRREQ